MKITLNCAEDITLNVFARVTRLKHSVEFGEQSLTKMKDARERFDDLIANTDIAIYGVTTGYGDRSKFLLDAKQRRRQASTPPHAPMVATGEALPARVVRGILLARLGNFVDGHAAISPTVAMAVADMLDQRVLPSLSLTGQGGAGEILALAPLFFDLASSVPLAEKDTLSLINGSPCAAALIADASIACIARVQLAAEIFALAALAYGAPLGHFSSQLDSLWGNVHDTWALNSIREILISHENPPAGHVQAPTSFRIIPKVLGQAHRLVSQGKEISEISLRGVTDNPVITPEEVISNGGFHDAQATAAMDAMTASAANLCILSGRLSARVAEVPVMSESDQGDGLSPFGFLPMAMTGYEDEIRNIATHTLLPVSGASGFGANDVASPVFQAWSKQERAGTLLCSSLAALLLLSHELCERSGRIIPESLGHLSNAVEASKENNLNPNGVLGVICDTLEKRLRDWVYRSSRTML